MSGLPALRCIDAWAGAETADGLDELRATLGSWAIEFRAPQPRFLPSLELAVVSDEVFDLFDSKESYGLLPGETNEDMLSSERDWLTREIEDAVGAEFEEGVNFKIVGRNLMRRSDSVIVYSIKAYDAFRQIVTRIQTILCTAKNDWIVYYHSDIAERPETDIEAPPDFQVWIYPQRITATAKHAETVRRLLDPTH